MDRWTCEQATAWDAKQPWLVGCNFIPSSAINQLEMWQAATFDLRTIERELAWGAGLGFNLVRVYLHNLAWETDPDGFKRRFDQFLAAAQARRIRAMPVFFDDCWNDAPKPGPQPAPVPGVHNSGWLRSPGTAIVNNAAQWPPMQRYVQDVLTTFGQDQRIALWDLYNEPGNRGQRERSLPLLREVFVWARAATPSQPLTVAMWSDNAAINAFLLEAVDVISFHNYNHAENLIAQIRELRQHGRPLLCSEWLRRGHSEVATCLPVFHRERVGCCNWGLVAGKTQTIYPWDSPVGAPEPARWFHDLLRPDGTPFDEAEVAEFRARTAAAARR